MVLVHPSRKLLCESENIASRYEKLTNNDLLTSYIFCFFLFNGSLNSNIPDTGCKLKNFQCPAGSALSRYLIAPLGPTSSSVARI